MLDYLGVQQLVLVIGGSMGGMLSLEWPLCYPVRTPQSADALAQGRTDAPKYIRAIALMASPARHSAWAIAWSEIQRMTIAADTRFRGGHYLLAEPPTKGLAAARMCAMITFRYPVSLERRFRRMRGKQNLSKPAPAPGPAATPAKVSMAVVEKGDLPPMEMAQITDPQDREMYAVQSYLHYHGRKFVGRFDPNCYIHLTHKLDAHDAARDRHAWAPHAKDAESNEALGGVLRHLGTSPHGCDVLIFSITSDQLYPPEEQTFMHTSIPGSELVTITSNEGHDAFLLEFAQIEHTIRTFVQRVRPDAKL